MSNVIQFLEAMGSRPALSAVEYAAAVEALDAGTVQRQALLDRDHVALNELLDGRPKMLFFVNIPNDDEQQSVPDKDGDGVPDQDEPQHERQ